MSVKILNPNTEVLNKSAALHMNINAAKGLQDVLKTNLGPKGTIKMLVGGAGDIKLTKDRNTLLKEMVLCIRKPEEAIDLFMVEIMHMRHKFDVDTRLEQREAMVAAEWRSVDERSVLEMKTISLLKGIDPPSLDQHSRAGDNSTSEGKKEKYGTFGFGLWREAVNSVDDLTPECLGWAGLVYEHVLGEEKYTFVENVKNPHSCTILIKGPNDHTIAQIKNAVRDGLRAVKNTIKDEAVGAGAFEVAARQHLINEVKKTVKGVSSQLLLVDEVIRAGRNMRKPN
ncbi:hypothetical protein P3S67_022744 [Capsicum chacoense]